MTLRPVLPSVISKPFSNAPAGTIKSVPPSCVTFRSSWFAAPDTLAKEVKRGPKVGSVDRSVAE